MPGDYNRVVLVGLVQGAPMAAGAGTRMTLRTEQKWTSKETGAPRHKVIDHDILIMQPGLVSFSWGLRGGDKILVEGTLERGGTVVLGVMHASLQLLRRASDGAEPE